MLPPTIAEPQVKGKEKARDGAIVIDLTIDEELADPDLARVMRESLLSNAAGPSLKSGVATRPSSSKSKLKVSPFTSNHSTILSPSVLSALSLETRELDLSHFCASAEGLDEERLLRCLKMDELREVAKGMKVWKNGLTVRVYLSFLIVLFHPAKLLGCRLNQYDLLIKQLISTAQTQSVLPFTSSSSPSLNKSTSKPPLLKQTTLSFGSPSAHTPKRENGRSRLLKIIKPLIGRAIIVNDDIRKLWNRLNLVFYRRLVDMGIVCCKVG